MTVSALETALDELFGVAPEEFIEKRKALAATLKGAATKTVMEQNKTVMEQKKPTRGAFLLNRLVRQYPGEIAELVKIGERLTRAHHGGDAATLGDVIAVQRKTVDSLRAKAAKLSTQSHVATGEISAVNAAVDGVTTSPGRAAELKLGRLSKPPEATVSFGADLGGFATAPALVLEKKHEEVLGEKAVRFLGLPQVEASSTHASFRRKNGRVHGAS